MPHRVFAALILIVLATAAVTLWGAVSLSLPAWSVAGLPLALVLAALALRLRG